MKRKGGSFSKRLTLNVLGIVSLLFIVTMTAVSVISHRIIAEEAARSASNMLKAATSDIEKTLQTVEVSVKDVSWLIKENLDNEEMLYHYTGKLVEENPNIVGSAVAFRPEYFKGRYFYSPFSFRNTDNGEVENMQLGNVDYDYFFMDWYRIPSLLGTPVWSEPYFDEGGGKHLTSTYSYPLKDDNDEVFAIVTADIDLEWLSEKITSIKPYEHSYTILVSRCGSFITDNAERNLRGETIFSTLGKLKDPAGHELGRKMVGGDDGVIQLRDGKDISFAAFGKLSNGWSAAIISQYRDVLARAGRMQGRILLIGLLALSVIFAVCYLLIRKLTRPLKDFSESALRIAGGDFDTPLPSISSDDEISRLRDSFETMEKSLSEYISNLKETTAQKERFESELYIARAIQMNMVPHTFPDNSGFDIHAMIRPAKEVGGDLYDYVIKGDWLYFAVGDVSGKGVPAALVMAITQFSLRLIGGMETSLGKIMERINDTVSRDNETGMFVTLFAGKINLKTREFLYCNAGHNPILVNGEYLHATPNMALGVFDGFKYREESMTLPENSSILLYTDGVTEAERADKSQFGEDRLRDWQLSTLGAGRTCGELTESLIGEVGRFTGGNDQNDDITIMNINC